MILRALDASGSFRSFVAAAVEAARLIIDNRRAGDEIAIEKFISSDKIEELHGFTSTLSPTFVPTEARKNHHEQQFV